MTPPPSSSKTTLIRNTSFVSLATIVLTVATSELFARSGVPLRTPAEYAVVAGFWLSFSSGVVWLWRRFKRRGVAG
jgi:ABC-type amino acid transport system permease subunit